MSPTARSLNILRRDGFLADVVERFIAGAGEHGQGIRRDWGHFGDILACHPGRREILLVQATTASNTAARLAKSKGRPELAVWLQAGGRFEVHSWGLVDGRWEVKIVGVESNDMGELADVVLRHHPKKKRRSRWPPGNLFADDYAGPTRKRERSPYQPEIFDR
jgi:hypothetical protein